MVNGHAWPPADGRRAEILTVLKAKLPVGLKHPNLFVLPRTKTSKTLAGRLGECLRDEFPVHAFDLELLGKDEAEAPAACLCMAIDSSQPERVRDAIKERLWRTRREARPQTTLTDILQGRHRKTVPDLRLDDYGVFFPSRTRRFQ